MKRSLPDNCEHLASLAGLALAKEAGISPHVALRAGTASHGAARICGFADTTSRLIQMPYVCSVAETGKRCEHAACSTLLKKLQTLKSERHVLKQGPRQDSKSRAKLSMPCRTTASNMLYLWVFFVMKDADASPCAAQKSGATGDAAARSLPSSRVDGPARLIAELDVPLYGIGPWQKVV